MKLIALDKLSSEQTAIVRNYLKISGEHGLLVGAVTSKDLWNTKPLIMRDGSLILLRFLDGMLNDSRKHREAFQAYFARLKSLGFSAQSKDSYTWFTRDFCQTVLTSEQISQFDSKKKRKIISDLVHAIRRNFKDEIIHGNICLSNIALDGDTPYLLDYCCAAFSPSLYESFESLAPEIKTGAIATSASDVYGLGQLISSWLGKDLLMQEKQLLEQMLEANPFKRPDIDEIFSCFEVKVKKVQEEIPYTPQIKSESISTEIRQRQPTTRIVLDPDSSLEEKLEWLKGTANLEKDLVEKIKNSLQESLEADTQVIQMTPPVVEEKKELVVTQPKKDPKKYEVQKAENRSMETPRYTERSPSKPAGFSKSLSQFFIIVFTFFILSVGASYLLKKDRTQQPTNEVTNSTNFHELWETGISSRMAEVAKQAVEGNSQAEFLIVKDVLSGATKPNINSELIKFAYNPSWEQTLNQNDRKLILASALSSLTLEKPAAVADTKYSPVTFVALSNFNPELSLPKQQIKDFSSIPGELGEAFVTLASAGVTDSDSPVFKAYVGLLFNRDLSKNLNSFFESDRQEQLIAKLLVMRSTKVFKDQPDLVLGSFLSREANKTFANWFKENPTVDWATVPSAVKLDLLSRTFPGYDFKYSQLVDLIFFPMNSVALEAKSRLLGKTGLFNSALFDVLMDVKSGLQRSQVSLLVTAFELKGEKHDSVISKWFDTKPIPQTVMRLLVASDQQTGFDVFSLEAARYLSRTENKAWQATSNQMETMSRNNEELVRALVVLKLDPQIPEHRDILVKMESREPNEKIRKQIRTSLGL